VTLELAGEEAAALAAATWAQIVERVPAWDTVEADQGALVIDDLAAEVGHESAFRSIGVSL
jgi:hypothetical protein